MVRNLSQYKSCPLATHFSSVISIEVSCKLSIQSRDVTKEQLFANARLLLSAALANPFPTFRNDDFFLNESKQPFFLFKLNLFPPRQRIKFTSLYVEYREKLLFCEVALKQKEKNIQKDVCVCYSLPLINKSYGLSVASTLSSQRNVTGS